MIAKKARKAISYQLEKSLFFIFLIVSVFIREFISEGCK